MVGDTESISDRNTQGSNANQLVENMYQLQQQTGKGFDINTNEGRQLKEAGWLDDRGYIDRQGFNRFISNQRGSSGGSGGSSSRS